TAFDSHEPGLSTAGGPARAVLRVLLIPRLISVFAVSLLGGTSLFLIAFGVIILSEHWQLAVFVLAPRACFVAALTGYVYSELAGKYGSASRSGWMPRRSTCLRGDHSFIARRLSV